MRTATALPIEGRNSETVVLELDGHNRIRTCARGTASWFGYDDPTALLGRPISHLFPQLNHAPMMHQGKVSGRLKMLSRCGVSFRARRCNGEHFNADLCINEFDGGDGDTRIVMIVRPRPD